MESTEDIPAATTPSDAPPDGRFIYPGPNVRVYDAVVKEGQMCTNVSPSKIARCVARTLCEPCNLDYVRRVARCAAKEDLPVTNGQLALIEDQLIEITITEEELESAIENRGSHDLAPGVLQERFLLPDMLLVDRRVFHPITDSHVKELWRSGYSGGLLEGFSTWPHRPPEIEGNPDDAAVIAFEQTSKTSLLLRMYADGLGSLNRKKESTDDSSGSSSDKEISIQDSPICQIARMVTSAVSIATSAILHDQPTFHPATFIEIPNQHINDAWSLIEKSVAGTDLSKNEFQQLVQSQYRDDVLGRLSTLRKTLRLLLRYYSPDV